MCLDVRVFGCGCVHYKNLDEIDTYPSSKQIGKSDLNILSVIKTSVIDAMHLLSDFPKFCRFPIFLFIYLFTFPFISLYLLGYFPTACLSV